MIYPVAIDNYYEPELIHSSFDKNYERYRITGDANEELTFLVYLNTIRLNAEELLILRRFNYQFQQSFSTVLLMKQQKNLLAVIIWS